MIKWYILKDSEEKAAKDILDDASGGGLAIAEDGWEIRPDRLLLREVLGEGAFGIVRRATLAPGGKEVAVKMLKGNHYINPTQLISHTGKWT